MKCGGVEPMKRKTRQTEEKKKELTANPVVAWMPMPRPFRIYSLGFWDADGKGGR